MPCDFIKSVLIDEIGQIHKEHPYISFAMMAVGIEFIGKCLNSQSSWYIGRSEDDFNRAINELKSFEKYRDYLITFDLYDSLRCGFSHSFSPKNNITISSGSEMSNHTKHNGKINFKCEDFYQDFKSACEEILLKIYPFDDKMNKPILSIPDETTKNVNCNTGTTYNE